MTASFQQLEQLSPDFLDEFKRVTEAKWDIQSIDSTIHGFQFQRGTRWNPGLSDKEIAEHEAMIGARFPQDFKTFLQMMNGTDLPTINVYGNSGLPTQQSVGVYSYPRDIEIIRRRMDDVRRNRDEIRTCLFHQGFDLPREAGLVPVFSHRYIVCTSNEASVVLSIVVDSVDAIVYELSLKEYLEREFL
jgi:hypothetical protein